MLCTPCAAQELVKRLDRRFPSEYCPIDNESFDLTFTAATDRVKVKIEADNFAGATWLEQKLDNLTIVPNSVFLGNRVLTPGWSACYLKPAPQNYQGYNFTAAGTPENFLDLFDANAAAFDLTNFGWWDNAFNASAPRNPASGSDRSGGALALGRQEDGAVVASTDFSVTGLTPGTLYVLTGWWSTQTLNSLTFTFNLNPCKDTDADGVTDCASDCNDHDAKIKPGAAEVCDGRDNDCNGSIDDAAVCVRTCTTLTKLGGDFRVTTAVFDSSAASIAWNGIDYGILWKDSRNGNQEIFFTHMTPGGTKVGGDVLVSGSCGDCVNPRLVWAGSEYGAVWSQGGQIQFRRLDRSGAPVGTAPPPLIDPAGSDADEPDIVWTGSEYGVAWQQFVGPLQIRFARLDRLGNRVSRIMPVTEDTSFNGNNWPRLAWGAGTYALVWQGNDGSQPEVFFRRIDQRQGMLSTLQMTNHNFVIQRPQIVWSGTEWGVAWQDHRTFTEIYFQRVSAAGDEVGAELRVTTATGNSNEPSLAWTGSEYGVVWADFRSGDQELWFARISAAGAKIGSDLRLTSAAGTSGFPSLAWGGGKYAVAWNDDQFEGEKEIAFLRLGCACADVDGDGSTSCVECDDGHATVFPGASQICDGLNNDCNDVNWPLLTGTTEVDGDGDGFTLCTGDCNDGNAAIWATPGDVRFLLMSHNKATGVSTVSWSAPASPGATSLLYDTLRSPLPSNFTSSAVCVETNDGPNMTATDSTTPSSGSTLHYLTRAENTCPSGQGVLGRNKAGTPTPGRTCP